MDQFIEFASFLVAHERYLTQVRSSFPAHATAIFDPRYYPAFAILHSNRLFGDGCHAARSVRREAEVSGTKVTVTEDSGQSRKRREDGIGQGRMGSTGELRQPVYLSARPHSRLVKLSRAQRGLVCAKSAGDGTRSAKRHQSPVSPNGFAPVRNANWETGVARRSMVAAALRVRLPRPPDTQIYQRARKTRDERSDQNGHSRYCEPTLHDGPDSLRAVRRLRPHR